MANILASLFGIFLASFIFFEACPSRALMPWGQHQSGRCAQLRLAAWVLMALALVLMVDLLGAVRGVPVWFGSVMIISLTSIIIGSWKRRLHRFLGTGSVFGTAICLAAIGIGA